jgi:hypothetical protein
MMEENEITKKVIQQKEEENKKNLKNENMLKEKPLKNFIEREFISYFRININEKEYEDQYIYQHVNGLTIIGIAPYHPILHKSKEINILKIDFNISQNLLQNKVKGKKKNTNLSFISCFFYYLNFFFI